MSTENLYNELIISFLNRIGFLQGAIYHLNSDIKGFEKNYKESREDSQDIDFRLGTKLVISDVSGEMDNGYPFFYPAFGGYSVTLSEHEEFNDRLINEYASFAILQSYEAFRRYLKRILALYYDQHNDAVLKHNLIRQRKCISLNGFLSLFSSRTRNFTYEGILNTLTRNSGKQDSQYFKYLRKISDHYRTFESSNNRKFNFREFHKLYAICRHAITHNNSILNEADIKNLTPFQVKILEFFAGEENSEGRKITLNQKKTSDILVIICEHAFFIYKSISMQENLEWKILKNMK